jgi:hypothetical protein
MTVGKRQIRRTDSEGRVIRDPILTTACRASLSRHSVTKTEALRRRNGHGVKPRGAQRFTRARRVAQSALREPTAWRKALYAASNPIQRTFDPHPRFLHDMGLEGVGNARKEFCKAKAPRGVSERERMNQ